MAKETPKENIILEEAEEILETEEIPETKTKEQILTEQLQRLQAEFENFRKRTEKEKTQIKINANENLISELLPILDNFELSLKHNEDKGIALIYDELNKVLEKQGLKKIDTTITFDPKFHEALIQVEGKVQGAILEELQKGYTLNERLLRASKVKISTAKESK
ncbi:nucleotide exchange factor GrpE [Candidatus Pacearchaeota archaeon]|nr:nucleotide exchange factor GrpE [Candidatus Pacearchaeota archaeon]